MSKKTLNIMVDDNEYLEKLSKYIFKNHNDKFIIKKYNDKVKIREVLKDENIKQDEIYLVDEIIIHEFHMSQDFNIYILSDKLSSDYIYKYLSGHKIIEKILENDEGVVLEPQGKLTENVATKMIGFYSPIGGIGTSTIAMSVSDNDALYISLETNSYMGLLTNCEEETDLSELFYHLMSNEETFIKKIKNKIFYNKEKEFNYISGFKSVLDYEEISEEYILKFLNLLKIHSTFKQIIVDIPSVLSKKNISVFEEMENIVFIGGKKPSDVYKMNNFKNEMKQIGKIELIDQYKNLYILNKYTEVDYSKTQELNVLNLDLITVPVNSKLFAKIDNKYKLNIVSEYKEAINKIIRKIEG